MSGLHGRVAIVTGGTSGIGRSVAVSLARSGAQVVIVGRDAGRMEEALALVRSARASTAEGWAPLGLRLDVRSALDMERMAARVVELAGRIDVLVTAAGVGGGATTSALPRAVIQTPVSEWETVIDTNLKGTMFALRAVLPCMTERGDGDLVLVSSSRGATRGRAFAAPYCASKFGVMGLSRALVEEVEERGVRVHTVLPDLVDTPMLAGAEHLSAQGTLAPQRVGDLVRDLLERPGDVVWRDPLFFPFPSARRFA